MSIRGLIAVMLLLAALGLGWQQRGRLLAMAEPASSGELRKCVNGKQVTYSNAGCPPGSTEQPVKAGTVTVVPGTPAPPPSAAASGPSALHKALDITRDDRLHEKIMERQIEGPR